jgi:hypothetical protein
VAAPCSTVLYPLWMRPGVKAFTVIPSDAQRVAAARSRAAKVTSAAVDCAPNGV